MKLSLATPLLVAASVLVSCSSPAKPEASAEAGTVVKSGRKVAGATGGHGNMAATAAARSASEVTVARSADISVFAPEDSSSPTLKGKHRQVAGATGSHGGGGGAAAAVETKKATDSAVN